MTYEEANRTENIIKLLNKRRMCPCGYCTDDKCVPEPLMDDCLKQDFVINKAIEALEKQIQQYPEYTDEYMDDAYCPACGKFEFEMGTTTWGMKYCPECGQAIDWGEEDEEEDEE